MTPASGLVMVLTLMINAHSMLIFSKPISCAKVGKEP